MADLTCQVMKEGKGAEGVWPCGRVAVAYANERYSGTWWPVCERCMRGMDIVPLHEHSLPPAMVVSAVRDALGQPTYRVAETVDDVIRLWPGLPSDIRHVIRRYALAFLSDPLCMDPDIAQWRRLADHIEAAGD